MEYLIVCVTAFSASTLTLFSGFGLGMILMPAFVLFFPVPIAVAATAVVHLANNVLKVGLVGRKADWGVVLKFAVPGAMTAMLGAALLNRFAELLPLISYSIGGGLREITLVKLLIGIVIVAFALFDLLPSFQSLAFDRKYLPLGGLISGFFGGLAGNQGALRAAFLMKIGLDKEAFIGTSTVSAIIVDVARLFVYGLSLYAARFAGLGAGMGELVIAATLAAFAGAALGARLISKVTWHSIQLMVRSMLIVVGMGMAIGLF